MSVDYPRAWEITIDSNIEDHHPECSWRTDRMLCDCGVLMQHPETKDDILQGAGGIPCNLEAS